MALVHVAIGDITGGVYRRGVAKGWFVSGDISSGHRSLLWRHLSWRDLAGATGTSGVALGGAALGGLTACATAAGGAAFAWFVALGGLAVAHDYAAGGVAIGGEVIGPGDGSDPLRAVQYAVSAHGGVVRVGVAVLLLVLVARALRRSSERVNRRGPRQIAVYRCSFRPQTTLAFTLCPVVPGYPELLSLGYGACRSK